MAQADYTQVTKKYKHLYGNIDKKKMFNDVRNPTIGGECSGIKCSDKFFAYAERQIKLHVHKLDAYGRINAHGPFIASSIMKGSITDFDFNPFMSNMVAVAGNNGRVAVSVFPKDGVKETINEATVDLGQVHGKTCVLTKFHPCAKSVLATASFDKTIKIHNIETNSEIVSMNALKDNVFSLEWNANGSLLACTSRERRLRVLDPRNADQEAQEVVTEFQGKSSKCFWVPRLNWIGVAGFNSNRKRTVKLWDLRDLSKEIFKKSIDAQSSVLFPYFDDDCGVLYLPEKGSGSISWWELVNDDKKCYEMGKYANNKPAKGGGWVPKRALDVWQCEVQRYMRLTGDTVEPVSLIVPRKAGADKFQEDIFPDCRSSKPAMEADEWTNGKNEDCCRMAMDPARRKDDDNDATEFVAKKTYAELEEENKKLKARLAELEAKAGISNDNADKDDKKEDDAAETGAADADAAEADAADVDADADVASPTSDNGDVQTDAKMASADDS